MKTLKTFIFTHNDLDGVGCGVIGKYYFLLNSFINI